MRHLRMASLLVLAWCGIVQAIGLEYAERYARLYLSTAVKIRCHPDSSRYGTAFLTKNPKNPSQLVLTTNKHLVQHAKELEVRIPIKDTSGVIVDSWTARIPLYRDTVTQFFTPESDLDLALVPVERDWLRKPGGPTVHFSSLTYSFYAEMRNLVPGQSVVFTGYPLDIMVNGNQPLLRRGTIAGVDTVKNRIYLDADAFGGSSGSPVFINYDSPLHHEFLTTYGEFFVGMIAGYVPFEKWLVDRETGRPEMRQTENSGIAVVVPAETIRLFADSLFQMRR
ncbi:MAG: serine protease [Candidatus Zixiibacteriota bacterium]